MSADQEQAARRLAQKFGDRFVTMLDKQITHLPAGQDIVSSKEMYIAQLREAAEFGYYSASLDAAKNFAATLSEAEKEMLRAHGGEAFKSHG